MNIWFATNNSHKKEELSAILGAKLKIPSEEGIKFDPEETGSSFCENSLIKARELKKLLGNGGDIVIADDSGICVDALDGRPGVLSARYGQKDGEKITGKPQNILLLEELGDNPNRGARFVCAMTLLIDENRFFIAQETLEGEIVKDASQIRGEGGFGYDPILYIPEYKMTVAELSAELKNAISHRAKAAKIIASLIRNEIGKA
jgi:XTP/dITP diphosphohydrolase